MHCAMMAEMLHSVQLSLLSQLPKRPEVAQSPHTIHRIHIQRTAMKMKVGQQDPTAPVLSQLLSVGSGRAGKGEDGGERLGPRERGAHLPREKL